jgi:hypothetical protein
METLIALYPQLAWFVSIRFRHWINTAIVRFHFCLVLRLAATPFTQAMSEALLVRARRL